MHTYAYQSLRKPRGVVLVTVMWIAIALTAVVLVLCREMMVESLSAKQHFTQAKVDAAELGAEQYILSVLEQEMITPGYKDQFTWEQRQIGDCYFWVLGMNLDDETLPQYGIIDEASKIDLNTCTLAMLEMLPDMDIDPSIPPSIIDWRNTDGIAITSSYTGGVGLESDYYQSLSPAYHAKNQPFETVEELRLIANMTDGILWGADKNHNLIIDPDEQSVEDASLSLETSLRGLVPYVTVYGIRATNPPPNTPAPTTTIDPASGTAVTLVDVNNATTLTTASTGLQALLQAYSPAKANAMLTATRARIAPTAARGGTAPAATPFTSIWDWVVQMQTSAQVTSDDIYPVFPFLVCIPPANPTAAQTAAAAAAAATQPDATPPPPPLGKVNVNTASKPVLMALPDFEEADADAIISYRESTLVDQDPTQVPNISWVMDCVDPLTKLKTAGMYITGTSTVFSADIVTVSLDGRAFKRVKIVVDVSTGTPQIIYRRDLTDAGWPMDPAIRTALQNGQDPGQAVTR